MSDDRSPDCYKDLQYLRGYEAGLEYAMGIATNNAGRFFLANEDRVAEVLRSLVPIFQSEKGAELSRQEPEPVRKKKGKGKQ